MEFKEFTLHEDLLRGIVQAGYVTCMPVQEQVLTHAFGGQDLYVQSQTGTGKTAAFLIVIFQRRLMERELKGIKAIIMVPTRELAVQVEEEAKLLGKYLPFKTGSFYGGVGYTQQHQMLRNNTQILVGTPGRVLDLNQSGQMNLMDIAFLVLDEADRMFDMGFYPDLRKLIKVVPPADRRQTMLFSATLNAWVRNLAWEYTKTPFEIEIAPETVTVDEVEQTLFHVPSDDKMRLLLGILEREKPESAIIFCNTKKYTEIVAKRLRMNGYECEFIIGDLPQVKRLKVIDDIKAGKIRYLAATDVAARGLDIEGLALVVNYDLPNEAENYVHRIGRTARAGKTGKAITLASEQDVYELPSIEKYIGKKIPSETAVEDLYAADKSEGARIQTDFYEDRSSSRDRDRGRDRHSGERGRAPGRERARPGEGRGRDEGRFPRAEAEPPRSRGKKRHHDRPGEKPGAAPPARPSENDISRLSFEDRMAYYKRKYSEGGAEKPPPRSPGKSGDGNRGRERTGEGRGKRPRRDRGGEARRREGGSERGPGREESRRRSPGEKPAPPPPRSGGMAGEVSPPAAGPPKKGLLSRILEKIVKRKE
jgi:ATP-dependent RNA helicase RhlB